MVGNFSTVQPTMCNEYSNKEQEFVFCVKGRPFGCLVSPHLPTPTSTIIDYNLVRDIGIKMSDLQYTKFSFGGQKMRILGKVSITVQTIHEGLASGNFHLKASVVLDLFKNFEIESIAGVKLEKQLEGGNSNNCTYSGALSTGSSAPSTPRSSPPPSPARSATPPRARSPTPPPPPAPRSPPGFPAQPQHRGAVPKKANDRPYVTRKPRISVSMLTALPDDTIRGRNIHHLEEAFCNADIMTDANRELRALHEADPQGRVTVDENRVMTFTTTGGLQYELGHARNRCNPAMCQDRTENMPNNCGYLVGQWLIPYGFKPCGPNCRAAYCLCINDY